MTDRRSSADLGRSAEAMLANLPFPEHDWESSARAVEARLSAGARGATDNALLAAPLPSEPGEPSAFSATTTPLTHSGVRTQSLAELARRSVEKKHAGEREVARASLAIAAAQPRPKAIPAPPPSAPPEVAHAAPLGASALTPNRPSLLPKVAIATSLLAIAAVAVLWVQQPNRDDERVAYVAAVNEPRAALRREASPPSANTATSSARSEALAPGVDPNSLPGEPEKPTGASARPKVASAAISASPIAKSAGEQVQLEDERAPVARTADKPLEKTLPPDPALRPADSNTGAMPVKPSTGAVQAALGSVMSGARHCVAGDDAPSSAVVLFGSDGRVQSVSVSGPAAGKASGACIQAQLGRARVQPFAQATFSVNATVRPD